GNIMASDAFMEISDEDTWGETDDIRFGLVDPEESRCLGAFEIFSFAFGLDSNDRDEDDLKKQHEQFQKMARMPAVSGSTPGAGKHDQAFTIKKSIDTASKDIWHIQIILGEELDETGGDGGGIPARQVVARTRYQHPVDFWNPLLQ